jgi:sn-glycerol 3-phosphate transport system substrate-binding protein
MGRRKIDIDVWLSRYPFPVFLETVRERVDEFEDAHPEYRINVIPSWWQSLPAEASEAAMRGAGPTIAAYYTGATQHARDTVGADGRPLYTSVEKAIAGRTHILGEPVVVDDLVHAARAYCTIDGDMSSMPLSLSTMVMYTNLDLLRAAGIDDVPKTWAEIDAACAKIARLTDGPAHAITWTNDGKLFQQSMCQQGAEFANQHNGRAGRATTVDLTCDGMRAYVDWWHRLHKDGHFLYSGVQEDWQGTFEAFAQQQVAFRLSSSFDTKYSIAAAEDNGFDIAVSPVPHNGDIGYIGNWIGGDSMFLADGLDEATQDGALAFMQYVNNPANAAEWHTAYGSTPVTMASIELLDTNGWFAEHPGHRAASEQLDLTDGPSTQALVGSFAHIQRTMMDAMSEVLDNGADPATSFTGATAKARELLDGYLAHTLDPSKRSPYCLHVDS